MHRLHHQDLMVKMLYFLFPIATLLLQTGGNLVASHGVPHHNDGDDPMHHHHNHRGLKTVDSTNNGVVDTIPTQGGRCGTVDLPEKEKEQVQEKLDTYLKNTSDTARIFQSDVSIDVSFHVIYNGATGAGNIPNAMVTNQIQVLNDAYAPYGFQFNLREIVRTNNGQWYANCGSNLDFKRSLRDPNDGFDVLYFYTCLPVSTSTGNEILGYATFPTSNPAGLSIDGVVCQDATLPGGANSPFNLGDTAVHEVGHWLGLFHTFQDGCSGDGDFVADTPAEARPAFGCAIGRDTCASPGLDPVTNYMDYSDDFCLTEFSPGQTTRMQGLWNIFRAPPLPPIELQLGVALSGQRASIASEQIYFVADVAAGTSLIVTTSGVNGDADLYVGVGYEPTSMVNDCMSEGENSSEACNVELTETSTVNILVFAFDSYTDLTVSVREEGSTLAPSSAPTPDEEDECGLFGNSIFCPLVFGGIFARFFQSFAEFFQNLF